MYNSIIVLTSCLSTNSVSDSNSRTESDQGKTYTIKLLIKAALITKPEKRQKIIAQLQELDEHDDQS